MRLAVAQAKLFHDTLEVTPTAFDAVAALESHSSADDTEQFELTMAFYEAFKWLLDEPHFDVIYDHNGDKAHEFARRAAYNFASYIISDLRYEHFEIARKLPPARLLIDQASWIPHPARRREFAFSTRMEAVVKSYREHSISQKELADDLGVYVSTISRYSPRRGRNSTMRTDAPRAANGFTSRGSASRPGPNLSISTLRKNLKAAEDLLFPPSPGVDSQTLDARVRSLEQRIAALEAKLDNGA
ncbi:hypothetical protein [Tsukamurella tyrosinosolvens]|uniref:hypothetical protein n=1 Tax=Tsukamurella tyrosinosolvens TaxID=57704 RepID=UPI00114748F3|nr:hypothetical protein [Tsukamurella tyrosinosolvens]